MKDNKMVNTYLYTRYERFWHWLQTALITILLVTGFEVDGLYTLLGYKTAVEVHNYRGADLADRIRVLRFLVVHHR